MRELFFHALNGRRPFSKKLFLGADRRVDAKTRKRRKGSEIARRTLCETRAACGACRSNFNRIMDISVIFKLAAIGIIITVVCQILKKSDRDDISTVVSIVGLVIARKIAVTMIGDLFATIREIFGVY